MSGKTLKKRDQIDPKYKWNIEDMYSDETQIDNDLEEVIAQTKNFKSFEGRLTESSSTLLEALQAHDAIWLKLERVYVYARMRRDEDNSKSQYQAMTDKCNSVIAQVSAASSFFTPELLSASEETLLGYIEENDELKVYEFYIKDILREKAHILTQAEENILAQLGEVSDGPQDIFTLLNNADMKFGKITDEDGDEVELTHGNYIMFMESHDRNVRKQAYESMYAAYKKLINTIGTTYNYNTKTDVISARIRKYESARAAALSGDNIPGEVYDNLVAVVNEYLPVVHRYMEIRKKLLGVDELHMYDIYVPLIELPKKNIPYEEGLDISDLHRTLSPPLRHFARGTAQPDGLLLQCCRVLTA